MKLHGSTIKELILVSDTDFPYGEGNTFNSALFINFLKTMPNINYLHLKLSYVSFNNWIDCEPFLGEKEEITFIVDVDMVVRPGPEKLHQMFKPQSIVKLDQVLTFNGMEELLVLHNESLTQIGISDYFQFQSNVFKPLKNLEFFKLNTNDDDPNFSIDYLNALMPQLCIDHPHLRDFEYKIDYFDCMECIEMSPELLFQMCRMPYMRNLRLRVNQNNILNIRCLRQLQDFTKVTLEVQKLTEEEFMSLTMMSFENLQSIEIRKIKEGISIEEALRNIGLNWPNIKRFKIKDSSLYSCQWMLENLLQLQDLTVELFNKRHRSYPEPIVQIESVPSPKITSLCFNIRFAAIMWDNVSTVFPNLSCLKGVVGFSRNLLQILYSMESLKVIDLQIHIVSDLVMTEFFGDEKEWENLRKLFRGVSKATITYFNNENNTSKIENVYRDHQLKKCDFIKIKFKGECEDGDDRLIFQKV